MAGGMDTRTWEGHVGGAYTLLLLLPDKFRL